ncbi:MAG: sugar phosphate isomerase/epimerase family protein [Planctomycetota bacterium]|nr:sugar phosphate isomerase/epimerase family protein [Planctomycetota bacterium]
MTDATTTSIPIERLGVCSWSLQPTSAEDLVATLQGLGVGKVQLALDPVIERPDDFGDAIPALRAAGIEPISGMLEAVGEDYSSLDSIKATGGVRPDEHWPATRARAGKVAELAGREGIPLVTMHAGFVPHDAGDPARTVVLDRLRELADLFAAEGVRLGLETGQETAGTLIDALDQLDHPSVGVNFDPANMILYDMGDPIDAVRALAPRIVQVHAKDATRTRELGTWGAEVPVGTGDVDWAAFLPIVLGIRPEVNVMIEREAGDRRVADIATARDLLTHGPA